MTRAFEFLSLPPRSTKPRESGFTMVLDKNLSLSDLAGLLETSGEHIDLVKLGWGTSVTMRRDLIAKKCALLRSWEIMVSPGGTLTELAYHQGKLEPALEEARALGFTCIEVSNGTVPIHETVKLEIIRTAITAGFRVISEVGSKIVEEDHRLDLHERVSQARRELEAGAWKVIIEARESGTLGIFDSSGKTQFEMVHRLIDEIGLRQLIFEAPIRQQQTDLILRLGNDVNLGNIAPADVIPLETLRLGLRGDTLRHFHLSVPSVTLELGASGALAASARGDVIVVADAIRASTTIVTALASGMRAVRPVGTAEECVGEVTAGERGGHKISQLDYDNSPLVFLDPQFAGKELVLTTSNGTECILAAAFYPAATVYVGALLNASAVALAALAEARRSKRNISIVVAGRNNQVAQEDLIASSEIALAMPGAEIRGDLNLVTSDNYVLDFLNSDSGRNLSQLGKSDDVIFCAKKDVYNVVPIYVDGVLKLSSGFPAASS